MVFQSTENTGGQYDAIQRWIHSGNKWSSEYLAQSAGTKVWILNHNYCSSYPPRLPFNLFMCVKCSPLKSEVSIAGFTVWFFSN
jgi:hypothetical protein